MTDKTCVTIRDSPDDYHDGVEDVKSVVDVSVATFAEQFKNHLGREDEREDHVRDLDGLREFDGLIVVLDAHGQRVEEDGQEDEPLEVSVIY